MNTEVVRDAIQRLNPGRQFVVPAAMPLSKLPGTVGGLGTRFILIENENGLISGVVDLDRVFELLTTENQFEQAKWHEVPVGNIAEVLVPRLNSNELVGMETDSDKVYGPLSRIADHAGMAAVVIGGQIFVNWDRVNDTIAQNHIDPVTHVPGRMAFNRRLREEVDRSARSGQPLAVLMIDLDHFKAVNDVYGHPTGDKLLRIVASSLTCGVRSYDFVARIGGDEFAVLCSGCGPDEIQIPVGRLYEAFERNLEHSNISAVPVTLSIGVAVLPTVDEECCSEKIIEQADTCLYRAKRAGRATTYFVELDPLAKPLDTPREISMLGLP